MLRAKRKNLPKSLKGKGKICKVKYWDVKLLEHAGAYSCLSRKCQHRRLSYKETKYFIVVFIRVNEITQLR